MNARRKLTYLIKSGESTVSLSKDYRVSAETLLQIRSREAGCTERKCRHELD